MKDSLGRTTGNLMAATFQVIPLSSTDMDGTDDRDEPLLSYPDALMTAEQ